MQKSRPWGGGVVSFGCTCSGYLPLHLYGQGFGEFEAEGGLGGQDDLLVPGVGRSCGSHPLLYQSGLLYHRGQAARCRRGSGKRDHATGFIRSWRGKLGCAKLNMLSQIDFMISRSPSFFSTSTAIECLSRLTRKSTHALPKRGPLMSTTPSLAGREGFINPR